VILESTLSYPSRIWGGTLAEIEFGAALKYEIGGNNCNYFFENH